MSNLYNVLTAVSDAAATQFGLMQGRDADQRVMLKVELSVGELRYLARALLAIEDGADVSLRKGQ